LTSKETQRGPSISLNQIGRQRIPTGKITQLEPSISFDQVREAVEFDRQSNSTRAFCKFQLNKEITNPDWKNNSLRAVYQLRPN